MVGASRYKQLLRRGLWRAPELLRHPHPPARGTQKSDIYSLGILLYEIIGRSGPWGSTQLSTEGDITSFSLRDLTTILQNSYNLERFLIAIWIKY